jgi:UDP-N-acetylglucosamine 2-epimerase (non-hydrolysing)
MREVTERPEGVEANTAKLIGTDAPRIIQGVSTLLTDPKAYSDMAQKINPYGDGMASKRILEALSNNLR